jgi:hypothetical protein
VGGILDYGVVFRIPGCWLICSGGWDQVLTRFWPVSACFAVFLSAFAFAVKGSMLLPQRPQRTAAEAK